MISIIIPAYNEEFHIFTNTEKIIRYMKSMGAAFEVLIVEESTDGTPLLAEKLTKKYRNVRHYHFDTRLGKGGAIEFGIRAARGEKIVFMDIDLATSLDALPRMIDALDASDVVIGSRYHRLSRTSRTPFRIFLGRTYAAVLRVLFLSKIRDYQCGFKGLRRGAGLDIARRIKNKSLFWDTEFLFIGKKLGYRITEIPVEWEEKRGRSAKISLKLIFSFVASLTKLFMSSLAGGSTKIKT